MTAGVNAVHRVAPLAALQDLSEAELAEVSRRESRMTHWSPISQYCCAAFTLLCRRLLLRGIEKRPFDFEDVVVSVSQDMRSRGRMCDDSVSRELFLVPPDLKPCDKDTVDSVFESAARWASRRTSHVDGAKERPKLSRGGFCVHSLEAALFFVGSSDSFDAAVRQSLEFAGPDNYCPVLVGALAGARFGAQAIPGRFLDGCREGVVGRCRRAAACLGEVR